MNVIRKTEPGAEPVSLEEAKQHLNVIDFEEDDVYIQALISVARRNIEDRTGRTLIDTTFVQEERDWRRSFKMLRGCARAVVSVKYDDPDGAEQELDAAAYGLHPYADGCAQIVFYQDAPFADLIDRPIVNRIRIEYLAGYGDQGSAVPQPLKQALLFLVAHYYENRTPISFAGKAELLPETVEALVGPYKIYF